MDANCARLSIKLFKKSPRYRIAGRHFKKANVGIKYISVSFSPYIVQARQRNQYVLGRPYELKYLRLCETQLEILFCFIILSRTPFK